jgi:hypothetical protein
MNKPAMPVNVNGSRAVTPSSWLVARLHGQTAECPFSIEEKRHAGYALAG